MDHTSQNVSFEYFEPIFKDVKNQWNGLTSNGTSIKIDENALLNWQEWHPPKKKKKLYKWIYKNYETGSIEVEE